jgi:hypothetical protein
MATATTMYHALKNPLRKVTYDSEKVDIVKSRAKRRLHKAFLRYHDPDNWPMIREALKEMQLGHLIGPGPDELVPAEQPKGYRVKQSARRKNTKQAHEKRVRRGKLLTQHTGLPPRGTR